MIAHAPKDNDSDSAERLNDEDSIKSLSSSISENGVLKSVIPKGIWSFAARYSEEVMFLAIVSILSNTPGLGNFVWPVVSFWYMSTYLGFQGTLHLFALGIISPPLRSILNRPLLMWLIGVRAHGRELLEFHISRSKMSQLNVRH